MTNEVVDELVQQLGLALGRDSGVPEGWQKIVSVVRIGQGTVGGWSKAYLADGTELNFYTEDRDFEKIAERLNNAMIIEEGKSWVACKVTVIREQRNMNIKFEWEDPRIWDTPLPF